MVDWNVLGSDKLTWLHSVWLSSTAASVTPFFVKAHSLALVNVYANYQQCQIIVFQTAGALLHLA